VRPGTLDIFEHYALRIETGINGYGFCQSGFPRVGLTHDKGDWLSKFQLLQICDGRDVIWIALAILDWLIVSYQA